MKKPPIAVILIAVLYIVAGSAGLIYHLHEWNSPSHTHNELLGMSVVRALAIVAGIFLLFGKNWARALALVWIAFHVVIGAMHDLMSLVIHAMLMVIVMVALFSPQSETYFSGKKVDS